MDLAGPPEGTGRARVNETGRKNRWIMADETRALAVAPPRLPYPADAAQFGYDKETWRVLVEAIFPGARSPHSVILALAYCKARKLDPLKRPVHIVAVWDSKRKCEVETIWPGIGELRTTAARTGQYAGKDKTVFGPTVTETFKDDESEVIVTFPESAQITVYRIVQGARCSFEGPTVYWRESYATRSNKSSVPNQMWKDRPSGQLEKCAEAASLRVAFPEEIGNDYAAEEMEGRKFESIGKTAEGHELLKPKRRSQPAGSPAPEPPQEEQPSEEPAATTPASHTNGNAWVGKIKAVAVKKKGTTKDRQTGKDKPYTIFSITGEDGTIFETFSDTAAEMAQSTVGGNLKVEIHFETDDYGKKIKTINPAQDGGDRDPGQEG
jgi:phage recombination protein Bet